MRIPRLFHPATIVLDSEFDLSDDAAHHVATVLRLKANHPVVLFNGDGNEYSAQIISVSRRQVTVEADACLSLSKESPLFLHLGQGISKGDRMDTVLQKSVELGVTEITPLLTQHCAVKLDEKRWEKKHHQWQKIILGACEQSGRNTIPALHPVTSLSQWLASSTQASRLVLAPDAEHPLANTPYSSHGYRLLIGPEGGLSETEIHQAQECGYAATSMGPRILRTETAAIAGLSILQALHGDY
ncbi:16S rRNA (uracil(1498)-N(3))-methyltransferase [Alteromonas pelagimontana]|uniref:Ribosomal RNA small subunit methyltransferase E n=1 Tax=Alteromonas pelagimontana TaxID=1858656 RepID=A0A6M4MA59_9ALTE|nr:16S rRNA (uracil(1498)-N(3))-methyltransferase [Alteromonas pelagimontana]QJR80054.1 16S rRNA (uracil(1498)-N(3))-methyltransferase [Alteromonas pelagimontana]